MTFKERLLELSRRVDSLIGSVSTEEATKTSFVMPFFSVLGYDVFNPMEFCPEYVADVGIKKGEKVDYAILSSGKPVILVECKSVTENLDKYGSQLYRYFGVSRAKIGVLTNGIVYRFYTDLDEVNKMDLVPFFEINIKNLKEDDIVNVERFSKSMLDVKSIIEFAEESKYGNIVRGIISKEFSNPSDEFLSMIVSRYTNGNEIEGLVERFRPVVRRVLSSYIKETVVSEKKEKEEGYKKVKGTKEEQAKSKELYGNLAKKLINRALELDGVYVRNTKNYVGLVVGSRNFAEVKYSTESGRILVITRVDESLGDIYNGFEIPDSNGLYVKRVPDSFNWKLPYEFKFTSEEQLDLLFNYLKTSYDIIKEDIITTEDELEAYNIIKNILSGIVSLDKISYVDTQDSFNVIYDGDIEKVICKISFDNKVKNIKIPEGSKFKTYYLNSGSLSEIYNYSSKLISTARGFIQI